MSDAPDLFVRSIEPAGPTDTALVWMHGFLSDGGGDKASCLRDHALAAGLAFTSFDFRGHGESGGSMEDLTCTGLLEDAARIVEEVRAHQSRVVLVGSSMGGFTAAWFAARHPDLVAGCVLIAPAFRFVDSVRAEVGPEAVAAWERDGTHRFDPGFTQVDLGRGLLDDWPQWRDTAPLREAWATPTLVIHGRLDDAVDWRDSLAFVEETPYARQELWLLADGDHRLTDHKVRLAETIVSFARGL